MATVPQREIKKDDVISGLLPHGTLSLFEASAGKGRLATLLHNAGHTVTVSNLFSVICEWFPP